MELKLLGEYEGSLKDVARMLLRSVEGGLVPEEVKIGRTGPGTYHIQVFVSGTENTEIRSA